MGGSWSTSGLRAQSHRQSMGDTWIHGLNPVASWVIRGRPMDQCHKAMDEPLVINHPWVAHERSMGSPWVTHEPEYFISWVTHGRLMAGPRATHGLPSATSWATHVWVTIGLLRQRHGRPMDGPRATHGRSMGNYHNVIVDPWLTYGLPLSHACTMS